MARKSLNAGFLTSSELNALGVENAAQRNILIHKTCVVLDFDRLRIGSNVRIDPFCVITCKQLTLGSYIHVGSGCSFSGSARIEIEDFSTLSHHCMVFSSSDDYSGRSMTNPMVPAEYTDVHTEDVSVRRHTILGARSILLPGATVKEGASTGAGTLVKGTLDPWTIYTGSPAKPLKPRSRQCLALEKKMRGV